MNCLQGCHIVAAVVGTHRVRPRTIFPTDTLCVFTSGHIRCVPTKENEKWKRPKSRCASTGIRGIPSGTQLIGWQNDELTLKKQVCGLKAAPA